MKTITHKEQQRIWDKEHQSPQVLLQMDSQEPSSGVVRFFDWLKKRENPPSLKAIEMGCGKGRNVIWLARQGINAIGFDFSPTAIKEAKKRIKLARVSTKAHFLIHDGTTTWPFKDNSFNVAIDCFTTTDIESSKGRKFAAREMVRVLKSGGYLLVYSISPGDEFHKKMTKQSPVKEKNAFLHPSTGKFEKTFDREELLNLYGKLELIEEDIVDKTTIFFGEEYKSKNHWMVFQKK